MLKDLNPRFFARLKSGEEFELTYELAELLSCGKELKWEKERLKNIGIGDIEAKIESLMALCGADIYKKITAFNMQLGTRIIKCASESRFALFVGERTNWDYRKMKSFGINSPQAHALYFHKELEYPPNEIVSELYAQAVQEQKKYAEKSERMQKRVDRELISYLRARHNATNDKSIGVDVIKLTHGTEADKMGVREKYPEKIMEIKKRL